MGSRYSLWTPYRRLACPALNLALGLLPQLPILWHRISDCTSGHGITCEESTDKRPPLTRGLDRGISFHLEHMQLPDGCYMGRLGIPMVKLADTAPDYYWLRGSCSNGGLGMLWSTSTFPASPAFQLLFYPCCLHRLSHARITGRELFF